jgi:hypothetical protein
MHPRGPSGHLGANEECHCQLKAELWCCEQGSKDLGLQFQLLLVFQLLARDILIFIHLSWSSGPTNSSLNHVDPHTPLLVI